jgi:cytochrome c553
MRSGAPRSTSFSPMLSSLSTCAMRMVVLALILLSGMLTPAFATSFEERIAPCLACHGERGQSETPEVPSLGAQPVNFLLIQLYMFREKLRQVEPMTAAAQGLSDEELRQLSAFISKLPPPNPQADPPDAARMERGRALVQPHRCAFCHQPDFSGREQMPRLASQREDYLVKTLREYKSNARHGYDASMAEVMYPIKDDEIPDLAHYLAHLR